MRAVGARKRPGPVARMPAGERNRCPEANHPCANASRNTLVLGSQMVYRSRNTLKSLPGGNSPMASKLYDFNVRRIDGKETSLGEHKGSVMLIVNVASKCGLTPQYADLEN